MEENDKKVFILMNASVLNCVNANYALIFA